jgi:hypothetical protein
MSSSFLYLAIVGVWAFVLVPRWLRRQYARAQAPVDAEVSVDVEYAAEYDAEADYYYDEVQYSQAAAYSPDVRAATYPVGGAEALRPPRSARPAPVPAAPASRSRMLRSRRRLLTMHLLLVAVAATCVVLKITSWLALIPPAAMLGMYLLLLRESAVADVEQGRRRAAMEATVQAARQRAYEAEQEPEPEPFAEIIDISARVGDQLYDQYADATVRAVGD